MNLKVEFNTELKTAHTGWSNWANCKQHPERRRRRLRFPRSCVRRRLDPVCSRAASCPADIVVKNSAQEKRATYLLTTSTNERQTHLRKRSWQFKIQPIMLRRRNVNAEKAQRRRDFWNRGNENLPNQKHFRKRHQQLHPKRSFGRLQQNPRRWWWIEFAKCKNWTALQTWENRRRIRQTRNLMELNQLAHASRRWNVR